jgi:hypothetical protein
MWLRRELQRLSGRMGRIRAWSGKIENYMVRGFAVCESVVLSINLGIGRTAWLLNVHFPSLNLMG